MVRRRNKEERHLVLSKVDPVLVGTPKEDVPTQVSLFRCWRGSSGIKSTFCSCRRFRFVPGQAAYNRL